MSQWRITIPNWQPCPLNRYRGRHWSREHKAKKEARELIGTYAYMVPVPRATGPRRVRLHVTLGSAQPQPDRDAYDKVLLDALVSCGLLLDDGETGLKGRLQVTFTRGSTHATAIVLQDCTPKAQPPKRRST
jgi:hypothetical protein